MSNYLIIMSGMHDHITCMIVNHLLWYGCTYQNAIGHKNISEFNDVQWDPKGIPDI